MISTKARSRIAQGIVLTLGAALADSAYADIAASDDTGDQLAEVVVTANKRTSTVQETAASITAVSSEEITDRDAHLRPGSDRVRNARS
jgi:outer membrane cobalamin receptor